MRGETWLDHLSERHAVEERAQRDLIDGVLTNLARILLGATIVYLMVGLAFLSGKEDPDSAQGGLARQVAFLLLGGLAVPLILANWRRALLIVGRIWAILLAYCAMFATVFWSAFPGITVRRFIVYLIVLLVAVGVSSALRNPRQFIVPVVVGSTIVLFANLGFTVLFPVDAWSDIGLEALHTSKNVAGMVAQAMAIVFAASLIALRQPLAFWTVAFLMLLALFFMVLTISKTALALTVLCVFALIPAMVLIYQSRIMATLAVIGAAGFVGAILFATGTLDLSGADWADFLTGDPTFTSRDQLWRAALDHIAASPYVGYGFGAQWSMLPIYHPLWSHTGFWTGVEEQYQALRQFHNGYLDLWIHGGFIMTAAAMVFLVDVIRKIVAAIKRGSQDRWNIAGTVLLAVYLFSIIISNLMESSLFFPDMFLGQFLVILVVAHTSWQIPAEFDDAPGED